MTRRATRPAAAYAAKWWISSLLWRVSQATRKLAARLQWKSLTTRSQTRSVGGTAVMDVSAFTGFGIGDRLERFRVVGEVHLLAVLVDRIDLVAAAFRLGLLDRH